MPSTATLKRSSRPTAPMSGPTGSPCRPVPPTPTWQQAFALAAGPAPGIRHCFIHRDYHHAVTVIDLIGDIDPDDPLPSGDLAALKTYVEAALTHL